MTPSGRAALLTLAFALATALGLGGCGTFRITPPAIVADPVEVYIADYGTTSKVVLPREDGSWTAWGFGEWKWYAEERTSPLRVPATVFVPTPGALVRRDHRPRPAGHTDEQWLRAAETHRLTVERERARALLAELDEQWNSRADTLVYDPERDLGFVRNHRRYWIANQSSTNVAAWMRELGSTTRGWTFVADYQLREPKADAETRATPEATSSPQPGQRHAEHLNPAGTATTGSE